MDITTFTSGTLVRSKTGKEYRLTEFIPAACASTAMWWAVPVAGTRRRRIGSSDFTMYGWTIAEPEPEPAADTTSEPISPVALTGAPVRVVSLKGGDVHAFFDSRGKPLPGCPLGDDDTETSTYYQFTELPVTCLACLGLPRTTAGLPIAFEAVNTGDELRFITIDKGAPVARTGVVIDKTKTGVTLRITFGSLSRGDNLMARILARVWDTRAVTLIRPQAPKSSAHATSIRQALTSGGRADRADDATVALVEELIRTNQCGLDHLTAHELAAEARHALRDAEELHRIGELRLYCKALRLAVPAWLA